MDPNVVPRILLLGRPGSRAHEIVRKFAEIGAHVHSVMTFDEALAAMRESAFDVVISDQGDFLALERAAVNQQSAMILENIGQGVCIVHPSGRLVWANPKMRSYPEDLISQVCGICVKTFGAGGAIGAGGAGGAGGADSGTEVKPSFGFNNGQSRSAHHRARRVSITSPRDEHFEITITPVLNSRGEVMQIAAVVWDVTHNRRLQKKIDAIDLAGRELVRLDAETTSGMNVEERISLLEQKILRYMHELLHFDNFAVLLIDKKTNRLDFVLQHGMIPRSRDYEIMASPEGNGISGYVASTGRSYICHDTSKDPRYLPGLDSAKSSLTVPLRLHDKIIGVFNIESDLESAFNEEDRQYAEILAGYIAIALNILDLLIVERNDWTGRLAEDVLGEISGPLNAIITEAQTLMEEYIGNDDLRHRLSAICDHVTEIKEKVREVARPRGGILGRRSCTAVDPLLKGKHILVADDEETIRETIAGVLRKAGADVETACDGASAIEELQHHPYDLLLADIRMPHKNGYEVYAAAREGNPDIAVILMTGFGYDPNHSIVRAKKEGLSAVLFKPFKVEQLIAEIRGAFAVGKA